MLNLTYKILVLLQSLRHTAQILPPSYVSQYWETTYVSDKVPDYWNHGAVGVFGLPEKKNPNIFPAWLTKTTTDSSSQVADTTPTENDKTEIFKTSTDAFTIENAELAKETERLAPSVDKATDSTSMLQTEIISTKSSVTKITETKTNSLYIDSIFTATTPPPEYKYFTRPQYKRTINDDDDSHAMFTTITTKETPTSNTIIKDSIFTTPKRKDFTRPKYETTIDDDNAHSNITGITQPTSTLEFDTTIYGNVAQTVSMTLTVPSTPLYKAMSDYSTHPTTASMTQEELSTTTPVKISSRFHRKPVNRAINRGMTSDPFSVFIRKLIIVLSSKRLEDLPLLINQFKEYVWILLKDGMIGKMGLYINSYIARHIMILDRVPIANLRDFFSVFHKTLAKRLTVLPKDVNDIIDYMDDTYDEAEEEAMQAVLHEASLFPNTRNKNKIAQGFVDYVFLHPMQRVMGTTRGKVLFSMMTEAVKKRDQIKQQQNNIPPSNHYRKNFNVAKIRRQLHELSDVSSDEVSTINKKYKIKHEEREGKTDSSDDDRESSKIIKTPGEINENRDETESTNDTKESQYYGFKNNENSLNKHGRKHRLFTKVNQLTTRTREIRNYLSKHGTGFSVKTKKRKLNRNVEIKLFTLPNTYRRTTTQNSANSLETTDSSKIEIELKAKIYDTFRRKNLVSRRMRLPDDSPETEIEHLLKRNIYKAVKKLLHN